MAMDALHASEYRYNFEDAEWTECDDVDEDHCAHVYTARARHWSTQCDAHSYVYFDLSVPF